MNSRKILWLSVPLILAGFLTGCSRSVDHSGNLKVPKLNEVIVNGDRNLDVNNRITVIEARKFIEEGSMAYLNDNYIAVYYPNTKEVQARTIGLAASNLNEMNNIVVNGNVYNAVRNVTSATGSPPSTSASASGFASLASSSTTTGTTPHAAILSFMSIIIYLSFSFTQN